MSARSRGGVLAALLLAALLVTLFSGSLSAQVRQPFEWIQAKRLSVSTTTELTGNVTAAADVAVGDDLTVGDTLAVTGGSNLVGNVTTDGTFAADGTITGQAGLYLIPGTAITVADGGTITPTTAIQELTAAGNVGAELAACGDGQVQSFVNLSNVTITITDTGTIHLAGNAALGQYDTLTVVGSGVRCIEVARANN